MVEPLIHGSLFPCKICDGGGARKGVGDLEDMVRDEEEEQKAWGAVRLVRCWKGWTGSSSCLQRVC